LYWCYLNGIVFYINIFVNEMKDSKKMIQAVVVTALGVMLGVIGANMVQTKLLNRKSASSDVEG
jgi:hypothetical protein